MGFPNSYVTFIRFYTVCISPQPGTFLPIPILFEGAGEAGGRTTQDKGYLCCGYCILGRAVANWDSWVTPTGL